MSKMGERLFEEAEQARLYQLYRIGYEGVGLEEQLLESLNSKQVQLSCAVDIGCGTGSFSRLLSAHFTKVIGVDCSMAQLEEAKRVTTQTNIEYVLGKAEDLSSIPNDSVGLITVAAAIHYLDTDQFFSEVDRILVPSGCLFVLMNGQRLEPFNILPDTKNTEVIKKCEDLMNEILHFLFQYFENSTQQLLLQGPPNPPGYFQEKLFEVTAAREGSIDSLMGLFQSFGVVRKYCEMNPGQTNILDVYRQRFLKILSEASATPEEVKVTITSRLHCWLFRKPENQTNT